MEKLEQQLTELISEQKTFREKAEAEQKTHGTVLSETKAALDALQKQVDAIDVKMAERQVAASQPADLGKVLKENESVQRLMRDGVGKAVINFDGKQAADLFERKTTITTAAVGTETSGVLRHDRDSGIVLDARPMLRVRNVLSARPTTFQLIDFIKVNSAMSAPSSPQVESLAKQEMAVTFTTAQAAVRTLAAWIPATRQILEDFSELEGFLRSELPYRVDQLEDTELLSGDNTGSHLNGLITQATAFNTALLSATAGWNKLDIIGRVLQQIAAANEMGPSFIILNPNDWWDIRLTKDSYGRYILGDPQNNVGVPNIFGLVVVPTTQITSGTFLVGSGNSAASEIRDRMGMQVEISTEHSDYFTKNMVAIRAEKRLALVVKRPASYITGSFTTSPA